ncbi:AfsR/SARP family transcriptional regulator [Streptomyces sp. NPDC042319]|uniref:AfsR/SARP family transcriptional regulator n=1 Tax=Streptomyces sp. NPDC042319 TaxID=3154332 RepID=UPI0033CA04C6
MHSAAQEKVFDFRILGPLEFHVSGRPVPVPGARQRALLCLLLLESGRTMTAARLIDGIWGERPPETAAAQLRICVSRLRKLLAESGLPGAISTETGGYRLCLPEGCVDVQRFGGLLREAADAESGGRRTDAAALLREGLALWRGPAADGLESPALRAAAAQLDEERVAALERYFDLEIHLGRHHLVIPELMSCAAAHPFREQLHSHLMLALYRAGRQVEALHAYRELKRRFADELGIEPSLPLRIMETKILGQNPELGGGEFMQRLAG